MSAARRRARGRFLVLEGLDGAGTTTQARQLAGCLRERGHSVHVTAEPSGGPIGAMIRQVLTHRLVGGPGQNMDPGALALLFAADRLDHVASEIVPRLTEGWVVISDRFNLSSLAYQALTCGGSRWVEAINQRALSPDMTLFLDVPPATALPRKLEGSGSRELFEEPLFQRKVERSYRDAIARLRRRGERIEIVDGTRSADEVTAALVERVEPIL